VKLMMYSHDTFGLGHIRRTLLIADHLSRRFPGLSTLILTGSSMIHSMRIPPNVDYVKVPCLTKDEDSRYLPKYLAQSPEMVLRLRREIIFNTVKEFEPDLLLVDKAPVGAVGELVDTLHFLRTCRPSTRVVLGLRDVLDSPEHVRREWAQTRALDVLETYYDDIWVYGSRDFLDIVEEYAFPPSIARKVSFFGYLGRERPVSDPAEIRRRLAVNGGKMVLMTLGGGGDGDRIVETFVRVMRDLARSDGVRGLAVTGPDFPAARLREILGAESVDGDVVVRDYTEHLFEYMNAADLVVSMSGYNTVCELLSLNKRAILVPRVTPRREQLIRARMFAERGVLSMIHPADLSAETLRREIVGSLAGRPERPDAAGVVDLNGLDRIVERFFALQGAGSAHRGPGGDDPGLEVVPRVAMGGLSS
jgi:predicted glycosyltransferase